MTVTSRRIYSYIYDNVMVLFILIFIRNIIIEANDWASYIESNVNYYTLSESAPKIIISLFVIGFTMSFKGSTMGKKMLKIKVIKEQTGEMLTKKQIFIREGLLKYIPWILTFGIWFYIEVMVAGIRKDNKPIHDIIMKTTVVSEKEEKKEKKKLEIKTKANIKKKKS